ncbi:hypothetical protein X801_10215 [Opisthorchis viverrini]|uniref:RRM domain-containing protein n=1 Tax=Opisthorchis viverrini TaxID=6198 RepID=A0A1S8WHU5_OPIVI|nr:hypothetical protein X801_10215 [Opisthorchis viverrini]
MESKPDESSSSDSTDSDFELEDKQEEDLKAEVSSLKSELLLQLARQPILYELHVRLINALRRLGDLDELRLAQENMNKIYPLSPDLWLKWIKDERKIATTDDEKRQVELLFKRAIEDYDDVSIWLEYCLFAVGNLKPGCADSVRSTESIFNTALAHQGLNVAAGSGIWDMYRDFQEILLSQPDETSHSTEALLKHMDKLYRRQLALPLLGMEATLESYKEFLQNLGKSLHQTQEGQLCSGVPDDCLREYQKALAQLELLTPFEDRVDPTIEQPQSDAVAAWSSYLDWIVSYPRQKSTEGPKTKSKETAEAFSPNHVCCLLERAVTANCLVPEIWLRYIDYLEEKLAADKGRLVRVLARSVRNCPWAVDLWLRYALASERAVSDELVNEGSNGVTEYTDRSLERTAFSKVEAVFEAALSVGLDQQPDVMRIWLAYCDYRLRRLLRVQPSTDEYDSLLSDLRLTFDRAESSLRKHFRHQADPDGILVQYQSFVEAKYAKNTSAARALWSQFMQQPGHGAQGQFWLAYLRFERDWGDAKHFYRISRMAINSINPDPEDNVFSHILRFSCEAGLPIAQYLELEARVRSRTGDLGLNIHPTASVRTKKTHISEPTVSKNTSIRKRPPATDSGPKAAKKPKSSTKEAEIAEPPFRKQIAVGSPKPHGEHVVHDPSRDDRTVFVSNLDYSTTEDDLRRTFEECGKLSSVRLVRDYAGRSKGYAYVEFEQASTADFALKKDRQPIGHPATSEATSSTDDTVTIARPMFVSRCDPTRSKSSGFQYSAGKPEPEKLFVRNLDKRVTAHALEQLFGEHGTVVSVRIATYRNGAPKGHAYVEFANADQASRALVATDGLLVGSKNIAVAISNPPVRNPTGPATTKQSNQPTKPKAPSEHIPHEQKPRSHGRTQLAFLPRALNRGTTSSSGNSDAVESAPASGDAMKSNQDFRKMFLS